jgi:DNA-directed RNA polymerase specialized sigma24 family protein
MSAPEIATLVEIPVGTVTSRLRRARELVDRQVRIVKARQSTMGAAS